MCNKDYSLCIYACVSVYMSVYVCMLTFSLQMVTGMARESRANICLQQVCLYTYMCMPIHIYTYYILYICQWMLTDMARESRANVCLQQLCFVSLYMYMCSAYACMYILYIVYMPMDVD
jgi:hypothetical protein